MNAKYKVVGFSNGISKVADWRGNPCYVDEDMSAWWTPGQEVELNDGQAVPEGDLREFSRLHEKYVGEENIIK
jgi:hypothetical protein